MKLSRKAGTTSLIVEVFVEDSSVTTGVGKTGIAFDAVGLVSSYKRNTGSASASVTLATIATLGTWESGGWKEVDSVNMPGLYELHIPNAALATGADSVDVMVFGASGMKPINLEIELTAVDNQSALVIKKNSALANFGFVMLDSTNHVPTAGLTVLAVRSINGAAFASCANSATEVSNGLYKISLDAADLNGDVIVLRFAATGADDRFITIITQS